VTPPSREPEVLEPALPSDGAERARVRFEPEGAEETPSGENEER